MLCVWGFVCLFGSLDQVVERAGGAALQRDVCHDRSHETYSRNTFAKHR